MKRNDIVNEEKRKKNCRQLIYVKSLDLSNND